MMKKKLRFRKRRCYSTIAALSLFAMCSNLHASDNVLPDVQEVKTAVTSPGITLAATDDESVSHFGTSITDEVLPFGSWNVTQVLSEKRVDGKAVKNTFRNTAEVQSIIPCPLKWEIINSKELIMHFPDNKKETLGYTLQDGRLIVNYLGAVFQYLYSVNNDIMTLTATVKSGNREENLIITLKQN